MTTFNTITDVNQPIVPVPAGLVWGGLPKKFDLIAPVPTGMEVGILGDGTRDWKIKPQSEMPWSLVQELEIIKMTPYSVGKVKTVNNVARLPRQSAKVGWNQRRFSWYDSKIGKSVLVKGYTGYYYAHSTWIEQVSAVTISDRNFPIFSLPPLDYSKELNEAKADAVSKSMNGFDLLTNLAELPETLGMILSALKAARHPLESMKAVRDRYKKNQNTLSSGNDPHKARKLRELDKDFRNQWLQYRYGIMPLVFSIQDAIKLLEEKVFKFHTEHSGDVINVSASSKPEFDMNIGSYVYYNRAGTIKIRTTGKAKFANEGARLSDLITFNPFLTAWELIPLSFVIDWFVNVGDVIFSNTSALMDISEQRSFCYSVKKEITTQMIFLASYDDTVTLVTKADEAYDRPAETRIFPLVYKDFTVLRTETEDSYDRFLFHPTDIDFQFKPSLGWMRQLDAYALSFSSISKLLKKLR